LNIEAPVDRAADRPSFRNRARALGQHLVDGAKRRDEAGWYIPQIVQVQVLELGDQVIEMGKWRVGDLCPPEFSELQLSSNIAVRGSDHQYTSEYSSRIGFSSVGASLFRQFDELIQHAVKMRCRSCYWCTLVLDGTHLGR
jgi:hypothetical protein